MTHESFKVFPRGFIEVCPSGALDKEGIMSMYLMPRDKAKVFIDEMFLMFDADGNGTVSFKVSSLDVLLHKNWNHLMLANFSL